MLRAHFFLSVVAALTVGACAYAPEARAPSWTDVQLEEARPSETPDFIPNERLSAAQLRAFDDHQDALVEQRDAVQATAQTLPPLPPDTEDYARRARERARPPESR
jgi:hypothetical protein